MKPTIRFLIGALLCLASCSGCTHMQLRRSTAHQIRTITDLQQQQIVDNLAMFIVNPHATPHFAVPAAGSAQVSDSASGATTLVWNPTTIVSEALNAAASRSVSQNWTLAPINDPDRLELMRCAYQLAAGYPLQTGAACPDCCAAFDTWYGGTDGCGRPCIPSTGWYGVGCKKDVPKDACVVGHFCGTYVWVPMSGFNELHQLTMAILDFATAEFSTPPSQEVVKKWSYKKEGGYLLESVTITTNDPNGEMAAKAPIQPLPPVTDEEAMNAMESRAREYHPPAMFRPRRNLFTPNRSILQLPR